MIAALISCWTGQQSLLSSEQPTAGNSVTILLGPVTAAKYGTVQLPVISGRPENVAVTGFAVVATAVSVTTLPVIVLKLVLRADVDEVVVGALVDAGTCVDVAKLRLASTLDNPAGEHPTKSGAVSLTAAHSCLLNWIAAVRCQSLPPKVWFS